MTTAHAPRAWILTGGWDGHDPDAIATWTAERLAALGVASEVVRDLDRLGDADALDRLALLVPNWTMGTLGKEEERSLVAAVERGLGLVGVHGGMGDAFRNSLAFQWLVGGQFVGHPGDMARHRVTFDPGSALLGDLPPVELETERYAMLVDPAVQVHAHLDFDADPYPWLDGVRVPVAWTRRWGLGRVAYLSVGHRPADLARRPLPEAYQRLAAWAARGDATRAG